MKKTSTKNKAYKNAAKLAVCALLCVMIGGQSIAFGYDGPRLSIEEIEPGMDELLDLVVELSLYDLTREEAVVVMLRNFLAYNPEMMPYLAEALLTAFDPYGGYYPNITAGELFSSVYRGFGIVLGGKKTIDGMRYHTVVERVFDESPADEAGLRGGDEIIKINGVNVEDLGVNAVSDFLSVCPDQITMTLRRGDEEDTVSIARSTVFVQSVAFYPNEETKTALIAIDDFLDEYMLYDIDGIVGFLDENNYENIIFDLRGNRGGDVFYMLETLNLFTQGKGVTLYTEIDKNGNAESIESSGHGVAFENICVLVDDNTASAAELFALSLREITGAAIIGEKTFGKGVGQYYMPLSNGDTAAITAFEVLSAKGTSYNGVGIEPDIKISPVYARADKKTFEPLNFVNCCNIKAGADNNATLALNQRLSAIGYILPEDATSKCTDKTLTAVEIFQKCVGLPVGIGKIDYMFIEYLDFVAEFPFVGSYEERDLGLECAEIYLEKGEQAAKEFAENNS